MIGEVGDMGPVRSGEKARKEDEAALAEEVESASGGAE
jgi:hypothetical protein